MTVWAVMYTVDGATEEEMDVEIFTSEVVAHDFVKQITERLPDRQWCVKQRYIRDHLANS